MEEIKLLLDDNASIKRINVLIAILMTVFFIEYPNIVLTLSDGLFQSTDLANYNDLKPLFNILVLIITSISTVIIIAKLFVNDNKSIKEDNFFNQKSKQNLSVIFFIMIGYILLRNTIISPIFDILGSQSDNNTFANITSKFTIDQVILYIGIYIYQSLAIAPITEEVLFRGIILKGMINNYSVKKSIIFSSLLFAIVHGSIEQGIYAFIGGILFSIIYLYTKSLKYTIIAHFINNLCMIIPSPNTVLFSVIYIVLGITFILISLKILKFKDSKKDK